MNQGSRRPSHPSHPAQIAMLNATCSRASALLLVLLVASPSGSAQALEVQPDWSAVAGVPTQYVLNAEGFDAAGGRVALGSRLQQGTQSEHTHRIEVFDTAGSSLWSTSFSLFFDDSLAELLLSGDGSVLVTVLARTVGGLRKSVACECTPAGCISAAA